MGNPVGKALRVIGIVDIIAGVILGLILDNNDEIYGSSFNFSVFILWSVTGFVSGLIFVGFSEIIELLHNINIKLGKSNNTISENNLNEVSKKDDYSPTKNKYNIYRSIMSDKENMKS
ncbi:hypothetical protein QF028_002457 [Neobacillus sp. B4I6]|jgi:hypothetical protein|uniref:hypothetical protein n=1 Tax=Neobacillus sp. B4I6 TaxID=3373925 RepID=UPI003D25BADB